MGLTPHTPRGKLQCLTLMMKYNKKYKPLVRGFIMSKRSEFMENQIKKTIAIVGLGYVGLPLALLAERKGCEVVGIDTDIGKVKLLNDRIAPFTDKEIVEQLKKLFLEATTNFTNNKKCFRYRHLRADSGLRKPYVEFGTG